MCARSPDSRKTEHNPDRGTRPLAPVPGRPRRGRFRGTPAPSPGSGSRNTAPAPTTAPHPDGRARRSGFRGAAATSISGLISACRARTTVGVRRSGRSALKNHEKTMAAPSPGRRGAGFRRAVLPTIAVAIAGKYVNRIMHPAARCARNRARRLAPDGCQPVEIRRFFGDRRVPAVSCRQGAGLRPTPDFYAR